MSVLKWGKPTIEICKYVDGVFPSNPQWVKLPTPKEDTTQLTPTKGDVVNATEEGGGLVDKRTKKNTYAFAFELFDKQGFVKPIDDFDGVVDDYYAVRWTPENEKLSGYQIDKASVSVEDKYTPADGATVVYTFDALVPDDESRMVKPYISNLLQVTPTALNFTSAADATGKVLSVTSSGTVTATSDQSWATCTVTGSNVTVKVTANSTSAQRSCNVTVSADGKQALINVIQAA